MKTLKVPYLPQLDQLDMSSVGCMMESKAQRDYVDTINWKEYPHCTHPAAPE